MMWFVAVCGGLFTAVRSLGLIVGTGNEKTGLLISQQSGPVVGLAGFEPAASSSRTKRATKLRYSPFGNRRRYYIVVVDNANRHVASVA